MTGVISLSEDKLMLQELLWAQTEMSPGTKTGYTVTPHACDIQIHLAGTLLKQLLRDEEGVYQVMLLDTGIQAACVDKSRCQPHALPRHETLSSVPCDEVMHEAGTLDPSAHAACVSVSLLMVTYGVYMCYTYALSQVSRPVYVQEHEFQDTEEPLRLLCLHQSRFILFPLRWPNCWFVHAAAGGPSVQSMLLLAGLSMTAIFACSC